MIEHTLKAELKPFIVGMLFLSMLVLIGGMSQVAFADTPIIGNDCGQVLSTYGERYYLTENITSSYAGDWCFAIANHYVELDCQGYTIDGNFTMYNGIALGEETLAPIVKNCQIQNFLFGLAYEGASNISIINNTFINMSYYALSIGYMHDLGLIANNTLNSSAGGFQFGSSGGSNYLITGNIFGADVSNSLWFYGYSYINFSVYNNYFGDGNASVFDANLSQINYNTTNSSDINILGIPTFGGNFWGGCADSNCDGYCDNPETIDAGGIDYLPLSTCFIYPPSPQINYTFIPYLSFQSEYAFGQNGSITTQFIIPDNSGNYVPINNGTCLAQVFYPNTSIFIQSTNMTYINSSGGIYKIDFTTPYEEGIYVIDTNCSIETKGIYSGGTFHVSNLTASYNYLTTTIKPQLDIIESAIAVLQGIITSIQTTLLETFEMLTDVNATAYRIEDNTLVINDTVHNNYDLLVAINTSLVPNTIYIW